ncbi:MAG: uroporphyrinogen decarboxylase family protein [Lentisphaerae bacterium]|nr:uroporphyrinogen decarboxylase family protein [Lentisphaerota bacterium]
MNDRERFLAVMHYQPVDRLPVMLFEPYESFGVEQWRREGLPADVSPDAHFGITRIAHAPLHLWPLPPFETTILSETPADYVQRDWMGATVRRQKAAPAMYYGYVDHPVKNVDDWRDYARRFDASAAGRIPADLAPRAAALNAGAVPVGACCFPHFFRLGFYAMGMDRFMTAFYDQPELIHEMFAFWSDLTLRTLRPMLACTRVDVAIFGEDLAYKSAPHISPKLYRDFWLPYQDPIVAELKRHGVPLIAMWTAGNIVPLLPMLMEHGFNATWPLEQMAGMDPVALRRMFGRELRLAGGISKEALIAGPAAIDREIERLLPVIRDGGFIPAVDDCPPPEVSLATFAYYIGAVRETGV